MRKLKTGRMPRQSSPRKVPKGDLTTMVFGMIVLVSIVAIFWLTATMDSYTLKSDLVLVKPTLIVSLTTADDASDTEGMEENKNNNEGFFLTHSTQYHTIFSTGCSVFQDWQSYVFFYHVFRSGQEGHVTRITSGCSNEEEIKLVKMFEDEIKSMRSDAHHLHLTPDYSHIPKLQKGAYMYFNKPYGVRHWMENELGYPGNHELHDDSIIILMDPDQIMLRPFTNDFTNSSETWMNTKHALKVEHGSPFAQQYGYMMQWRDKVNLTQVFRGKNYPTPVSNLSRSDAIDYFYAMGPPYIATAKDMWSIVNVWSEIAPFVHNDYPHLLAEMFAYNLAVAHLGLRHSIARSFMVSYAGSEEEGWAFIDKIPSSNVCQKIPESGLPHVIHYCQRYVLGKWLFFKYELRKDFISCEAPLLTRPPDDLALKYTGAWLPDGRIEEQEPRRRKWNAFMICAMIDALNDASKFYKDQHCKDGSAGNYDYSYVMNKDMHTPNETIPE